MKKFDETPSWGRSREMSLRDKEKHMDECEEASWECPKEKGYCLMQVPLKEGYVCGQMIDSAMEAGRYNEIPPSFLDAYRKWIKDNHIEVSEKNKP